MTSGVRGDTKQAPESGKAPGEEQVSRVACRIFREQGYHATSMRTIASALGWQPAALYYYYASKEDLLFSIMETAVDTLTLFVQEHVNPTVSPSERLRQAITAHVALIAGHLDELSVFLHEMKALNPRHREVIQAKTARYEHVFRDIIQEGMQTGELEAVDPRLARHLIMSACNGMYTWYRPEGPYAPNDIGRQFGDMLLRGLQRS